MKRARMMGRAMRKLAVVAGMLVGGSFIFGGCTLTTLRDQMVAGGLNAVKTAADGAVNALIPAWTELFPKFPDASLFNNWGV